MSHAPRIHPTALVSVGAELDASVEIGPWSTVGPHVRIGRGSRILSHVVLEGHSRLGEDNTVYPFSVLGAVPQDLKYRGEATELIIGDRNVIRESVTMNLGTHAGGGRTQIGNDCLIMAYTHLGHDSILGSHCIIANYGGLAGHVSLEDHVIIGGMTGISQHVRVGAHAYIGGASGLERDVPPFCIALGSRPCAIKGANIVGLKRRGFSAERIQKINEVIKLWVRPEFPKEQCLLEIESQYGESPDIQIFLRFIRESERGVVK